MRNLFSILILATIIPTTAWALPIDWHGVFGVDSTLIDNFRRIKQSTDTTSTNAGSQEVGLAAGNQANASFQSYIFRLQPTMIINDAASLKGELSTNYARGGRFGDNSTRTNVDRDPNFGSSLYTHNTTEGEALKVNQLYAELYSDAATWQIGRHSFNWALGAVYDDGNDTWDRFATARDGVTAKIKIGNFQLTPYWAKIAQTNYTRASRIREYGASVLYDNVERDLAFGLLYGKKQNSAQADGITGNPNGGTGTESNLGSTDVTVTDIYFAKKFGDVSVAIEVPLMSGEVGNIFENGGVAKYKAKALLLESSFMLSSKWKLSLWAGQVSGQGPGATDFEAMYLHPNYQIANLMFRYDLRSISSSTGQVYDSYINNATYAKFGFEYSTGKWTWDSAFIWAKADQVAKDGQTSYNHDTGKTFTANGTQSDDLGMEIDLGFNYRWNNEVHVGGSAGYLMTGDYYAYTNDPAQKNDADNTFVLQIRTAIDF